MIVSHRHKFIFIKTKKTAGTSLEIALSAICGPDDIITEITPEDEVARKRLGFPGAQNFMVPFHHYSKLDWLESAYKLKRLKYRNHMSASEIKEHLEPEIWHSYYKFAFDRNPYDKIVSFYYWRGGDKEFGSIEAFLKSGVMRRLKGFDMYAIDKLLAVDDLFAYEKMEDALQTISSRLKLDTPLRMPEYKAKSGTRKKPDYRTVLNTEARQLVEIAFAREIRLLGYTFE